MIMFVEYLTFIGWRNYFTTNIGKVRGSETFNIPYPLLAEALNQEVEGLATEGIVRHIGRNSR